MSRPRVGPSPNFKTALRCECGSPDWYRCAPGTTADAKSHPGANVVDIRPADEVPMRVWCAACDPWVRRVA